LEQLWDNSPAVPLPIPVAAAGSEESNNICLSGGGKDVILQKIFEYAWPDYCRSGSSTCPGYASPVTKKGDQEGLDNDTLYAAAVNRSKYKGDGCYGGGVDCGAFVTIVMRESGADIEYNTGPQGNTTQQLEYLQRNSAPGGKYRLVADTEELVGGDIAIRKEGQFGGLSGHTFFYVGNITGPNGEKFNGDSASASQCGRAPMAGPKDTRSEYYWYRMTGVDAATPPPTGGGPI
jgi:hypothetical protein